MSADQASRHAALSLSPKLPRGSPYFRWLEEEDAAAKDPCLLCRALFTVLNAGGGPCSRAELLAWWCATQFSVERVMLRFSHATGVGIGQDCPCCADQVSSVERLSAKPSANEQFEAPGVAGGKQVSLDQPVDEPSRSDIDEQGVAE